MAEMIRRTKVERFVTQLELDVIDLEERRKEADPAALGWYYEATVHAYKQIISKMKREFDIEDSVKQERTD